jgi:hypothetical protein
MMCSAIRGVVAVGDRRVLVAAQVARLLEDGFHDLRLRAEIANLVTARLPGKPPSAQPCALAGQNQQGDHT